MSEATLPTLLRMSEAVLPTIAYHLTDHCFKKAVGNGMDYARPVLPKAAPQIPWDFTK